MRLVVCVIGGGRGGRGGILVGVRWLEERGVGVGIEAVDGEGGKGEGEGVVDVL